MLVLIALVAVFGILVPWSKGIDFLDPVLIGAYACMGGLFAAPYAARLFQELRSSAEAQPVTFRAAIRAILRALGYGEGLVFGMLVAGIITINVGRAGSVRLPEIDTLVETALFGLTLTLALISCTGWITLKYSPAAARLCSRVVFMLLVIAFFYESRRLPEIALNGAGVAALVSAGLIFALKRQTSSTQTIAEGEPQV